VGATEETKRRNSDSERTPVPSLSRRRKRETKGARNCLWPASWKSRRTCEKNKKRQNTYIYVYIYIYMYIYIYVYIYICIYIYIKAKERDEGSEELFVAGKLEVEKNLQKTRNRGTLYIYTYMSIYIRLTRRRKRETKGARNCLWPASWKSRRTYRKQKNMDHFIYIHSVCVFLYVHVGMSGIERGRETVCGRRAGNRAGPTRGTAGGGGNLGKP